MRQLVATLATVAAIGLLVVAIPAAAQFPPPSPNVSTFATGLNNPRQLKFGPDNALYVAEGGSGGSDSTDGECDQVVPPLGPYTGSATGGRISRIDGLGHRTTVTDTLPSSQTSPARGSLVSGVADIAWVGNAMYALLAGAGCSHGVTSLPNGIVRVRANGTWALFADLGAFQQAHPVADPEPDDFEPDGTWYSMLALGASLYAVEPNHGELDRVTHSRKITRLTDISASQGHIVPTAMIFHRGSFYVANLSTFPLAGDSKLLRINPGNGSVRVVAEGLTGRVVQVGNGDDPIVKVIATGLVFPSGMTIDPAGEVLYISNYGFGFPPGAGQVVRVRVAAP